MKVFMYCMRKKLIFDDSGFGLYFWNLFDEMKNIRYEMKSG